jgi:hypothetical protein
MCGVPSEGDRFERAVLDVYRQSRGKQRGGKREGYDPIHGRHFSIPISRRSLPFGSQALKFSTPGFVVPVGTKLK